MEVANNKSVRFRAAIALSGAVSLLCSLFHFMQQNGLKSNGTYYVPIFGVDAFALLAIVLMIVSVVLYIIGQRSNADLDQHNNTEIHYAQYRASGRIVIGAMFAFLLVFIISQTVNHVNDIKSNTFSLSAILVGFAADLFIVWNVTFYFRHRSGIKVKGEKTDISVLTQVSFFLASQIMWMYLLSVYTKSSFIGVQYIVVPVFFIGILGLIICLAILRSRIHSIASRWSSYLRNPRRMDWVDGDCLRNAAYIFLICIVVVFAMATVLIPENTAM
jgi:hypothetical protein